MDDIQSIVSTGWLADRIDDPTLRVVDVTTFLRQPGAVSGQFHTKAHTGAAVAASGALHADFFRGLTDAVGDTPFVLNGTAMRLTIHPRSGGPGDYRFWSGRETYEEAHIPGAIYADIDDFSDPDADLPYMALGHDEFARKMGELGLGEPGSRVVIYDQGVGISFWASRLWWQLRLEGFDDVAVLEGGMAKWTGEGRPSRSGVDVRPPVQFAGRRNDRLLASLRDVEQAIGDPAQIIVDSLSPADFSGEASSYGARGHIPGSVNIYCATHTDGETNELIGDEVLRARLEPVGVLDPETRVIAYCGAGIGATWNALILHTLGKTDVAVFDGSMFEWSADVRRPLET